MIFHNLRTRFAWLKVIWAYYRDDLSGCRTLFERYAQYNSPTRFQKAFDATLMILETRYAEAQERFRQVLSEAVDGDPENGRYIDLYCRYYISLADKDGGHLEILRAAKECKPSRVVRRTLPLFYAELDGLTPAGWLAAQDAESAS